MDAAKANKTCEKHLLLKTAQSETVSFGRDTRTLEERRIALSHLAHWFASVKGVNSPGETSLIEPFEVEHLCYVLRQVHCGMLDHYKQDFFIHLKKFQKLRVVAGQSHIECVPVLDKQIQMLSSALGSTVVELLQRLQDLSDAQDCIPESNGTARGLLDQQILETQMQLEAALEDLSLPPPDLRALPLGKPSERMTAELYRACPLVYP